ncbi:MAG: hypothetical protein Q8N05_00635 [Bacteroidota bacterium]|nr:hypothetical protein [Bacteroidota bacterium]
MQFSFLLIAQSFTLGWSGVELVPKSTFNNSSGWITNVPNAGLGDKSIVTASGDTLKLNWTFGTGNRYKWAQCYLSLPQAISLEDYDLFGFNLKGMPNNGYVGFELKFEDGTHQAVVRWDGLAGLNRWAEKISASKKQFENSASMDWSKVRVISLAVYAQASDQYVSSDKGSVSIYQLVGTKMANWERATSREFINAADCNYKRKCHQCDYKQATIYRTSYYLDTGWQFVVIRARPGTESAQYGRQLDTRSAWQYRRSCR